MLHAQKDSSLLRIDEDRGLPVAATHFLQPMTEVGHVMAIIAPNEMPRVRLQDHGVRYGGDGQLNSINDTV